MCTSGSTTATSHAGRHTAEPIDAVIERLNDPAVAAAMVTLLDNAELLSSLVLGLAGVVGGSDPTMESEAESVIEFHAATANGGGPAEPDDDARKGMELLVEIARAIGRRMP